MNIKYLFLIAILFITGCSNIEHDLDTEEFNIVTSFYPVYIFTQNIVKDVPDVTVSNMSNDHLGCLHDYTLSTKDMKLIDKADAFVINGAGMETFLEKIYETKENLEVIDSSENITLIENRFSDSDNEHIWLSISNAIIQTQNICEKLIEIDNKNAVLYEENTKEYIDKLEKLKNELREMMYGNSDISLITQNDAFPYFAKDFGFEILEVIEKEEGESPTSKELQNIIEIMKKNEIKSIFVEEDSSTKVIETIANETGAKIYTLDSITSGEGNIEDYENRMRNNIKVIKESL